MPTTLCPRTFDQTENSQAPAMGDVTIICKKISWLFSLFRRSTHIGLAQCAWKSPVDSVLPTRACQNPMRFFLQAKNYKNAQINKLLTPSSMAYN